MSIIYDALKKVELTLGKPLPDHKPKTRPKIYLLYIAVVCLGFLIANLFFSLTMKKPQMNLAQKQSKPSHVPSPLPEPVMSTSPLTSQEKPRLELVLNGIFFSQEEGYALINNRILKEGDTIEGATVVRITLEGVELQTQDSVVELSNNPK